MDGTKRKSGSRGFTLIEMTVVITILALFAALVLPNMVAIQRSQEARRVKTSLYRLPGEARDEARRSGAAVSLRVDGDAIVMERHAAEPATTDMDAMMDAGVGSADMVEEVKRLSLNGALIISKARLGPDTSDVDSWQWTVYPDGSADTASLEFQQGNKTLTLILPSEGNVYWIDGEEPDPESERWSAGEIETRAQ